MLQTHKKNTNKQTSQSVNHNWVSKVLFNYTCMRRSMCTQLLNISHLFIKTKTQTHKPTNKQQNTQTNKQTNKQTHKQTNKKTNTRILKTTSTQRKACNRRQSAISCLFVCLSVCLFLCLFVCFFVCLFVCFLFVCFHVITNPTQTQTYTHPHPCFHQLKQHTNLQPLPTSPCIHKLTHHPNLQPLPTSPNQTSPQGLPFLLSVGLCVLQGCSSAAMW